MDTNLTINPNKINPFYSPLKFLYTPNIPSPANINPNIKYSNARFNSFHPIIEAMIRPTAKSNINK